MMRVFTLAILLYDGRMHFGAMHVPSCSRAVNQGPIAGVRARLAKSAHYAYSTIEEKRPSAVVTLPWWLINAKRCNLELENVGTFCACSYGARWLLGDS